MKKRVLNLIIVAVVVCFMLAGCAQPVVEGADTQTTADPASETSEDTTEATEASTVLEGKIVVAASANWIKDIDEKLAEKFTEETGVEVEFQITPDDQYADVVKAKLATGEGPDVFLCPAGMGMETYLPEENFLDLSNEPWVERVADWAIPGMTYNGKIVAMNEWSSDGWGFMYDPVKFEDAGITSVPKTYAELVTACEALTVAGYTPIYALGNASWHSGLVLSQLAGVCEEYDSDYATKLNSNELKFADIDGLENALQEMKNLADSGYYGEEYMADTWEASIEKMASGDYAMIMVYTTYCNEVKDAYPDTNAENWLMFPIPFNDNDVFAMGAGGAVHVINKKSENINAAKAYLDFRARQDIAQEFYAARTDLGEAAFIDVEGNATPAGESAIANAAAGTTIEICSAIKYFDITLVGQYIQELYLGTMTPMEVLHAIDTDRQKMFDATEE